MKENLRRPLPRAVADRLQEVGQGFQQMLEENPCEPVALAGMSLVALASHQAHAAIHMALAAVHAAPEMGPAWLTLGQAYKQAGQLDEAESAYLRVVSLHGMDPLAHMALGELRIAQDRPADAVREYELALQTQPLNATALLGVGHALACQKKFAEALERYDHTLEIHPRLPEAEFAAGYALVRLNRGKEAEVRYRRALALRPDFAAAWLNLGSLLREQGREVYAEAALVRALELRPELVGGWINLGLMERDRKCPEKAEKYLRNAFALDQSRVDTMVAWAQFRASERDMEGAWQWLRWGLARDPENAEAVNMQGILLHNEGRFEEAVAVFERAERLGSKPAPSNRGNSLLDLERVDEALAAHQLAVANDPENPGARYNLAMTQLRVGDYARGWPGYEARWKFRSVHRVAREFKQPRWQGEPLDGQTVLLHAEQGLGDTIQFCRYVPLVVARGGRALLQVQTGVKQLLGSLASVRAGLASVADLEIRQRDFDLECPLMSLPAVFGTTMETVPWTGPYLGAPAREIAEKKKLFPNVRSGPGTLRVGIAWAGNPGYRADQHRSTTLRSLYPLLRVPGVTWISLQKGEPAEQLQELPGDLFVWDGSSCEQNLAETAALIGGLDLVISTDTCIPHLAGAMGKPVWFLLPRHADWRWMSQRETTPWYPTARLLRQRERNDWEELIERTADALRLRLAAHSTRRWAEPLDARTAIPA